MISLPQIQLACDICDKRVEVETHPKAAEELGLLRHSWDWPLCAACEIPHDPTGACFPGYGGYTVATGREEPR